MPSLPGRRTVAKYLVGGAAVAIFAACTAPAKPTPSNTAGSGSSPRPVAGVQGTTAAGPAADSAPLDATSDVGAAVAPVSPAEPWAPPGPGPVPSPGSPVHALKTKYSLSDPNSPWVLVNKHLPLHPLSYEPPDLVRPALPPGGGGESALLRTEAAAAAARMFEAAGAAGAAMTLLSSYRSYDTQVGLYGGYAAQTGRADADTKSARAGYSEHQTGLALDIGDASGFCSLNSCFAATPAAVWAAANCHLFGFIVRYQLGHDGVTGFYAEPWHLRYLGVELATAIVAQGFSSYEEFLGVEAAADYL
ncbi:D-alanyl-D-alanine carboxypeptidase family protein [Paeniglutamicibacter antarcticus]|uniref:D-alanyl-D-alanine carboxypeptidase family protein n=1 Tax=Arthrobacter terrae TaxID=2935737 RepID=A0A931CK26_9MICC|nr:M15 family metallopeptidase [Arthrobacter terrae]MBG0740032.1 D-alanyl-D-alanine carboxypeptidase family protein [Arthrobacter terrae]